ncbi:tRNA (adenosine(37)-N6)-threonylcarbamoyltransferase complex ATPase subunit type 1 TsaE [Evansella tamaricis]|uniref:tRNA (Adenosine(37)-N6)-threonylcarbamoyltransferase complex ATPase subunit type 1 TsaE n=1 Tax=Evansella tamaricis TaxID=2069301 RepID=A0ABS6JK16_9BACI|nr:tRNA (adenosine(37)-N6)-threonylcarbamoyltransferase complex ATPase subunit type 1 TsaE [Evansella tamaricis]MBU9713544.1 tRNA (adenosine(37)-N6)-threonylcarbamoyltransferase complex ATPase subunit type 1 TsaE [Evansella tamaricis]
MTYQREYISHSLEETQQLAEHLANLLKPGDLVTLEGNLGAGKTSFTKGLAKGLGVAGNVNSPTFTIIKEYQGKVPFYHMDAYRVEDELEDLGLDEYFEGDGVTVVEWPSMIEEQLPKEKLAIRIEYMAENKRKLTFMASGSHFISVCKEIF